MKIAVIGLGLIGASLARALSPTHEITGIDREDATIEAAIREKVIARGGADLSLTAACDTVVIALPVGSIVPVAHELIPYLEEGSLLTDTGSTKAHIVRELSPLWPWFIGSHPMAGTEDSGYRAGFAELFVGAVNILTPTPNTSGETLARAEGLWEACGAASLCMDPEEHDELMARISHLPHLLSFAFMPVAGELTRHQELLGRGFRDFTRIAASDPVMWRDIFLDNRAHLLGLIEDYIGQLKTLKDCLRKGEGRILEDILSAQRHLRRIIDDNPR